MGTRWSRGDPHPAGPADEEGAARLDDPRLQAAWTTTLFAALDALDGTVFGKNMARRHQQFIRFLNALERDPERGRSRDPRQLRHAQDPAGAALAGPAPALDLPLHADVELLAECGRGLLREALQAAPQGGVRVRELRSCCATRAMIPTAGWFASDDRGEPNPALRGAPAGRRHPATAGRAWG